MTTPQPLPDPFKVTILKVTLFTTLTGGVKQDWITFSYNIGDYGQFTVTTPGAAWVPGNVEAGIKEQVGKLKALVAAV